MCPTPALRHVVRPAHPQQSLSAHRRSRVLRGHCRTALFAAVATIAATVPAAAQQVLGRLLDSSTKAPVMLGRVTLLDTAMAVIDQTYTDEDGFFTLKSAQPGSFYVAADRFGYFPRIDGVLDVGEAGRISVHFYLKPKAIAVEPISVVREAADIQSFLKEVGFVDRMNQGGAWYLTREDLEKRIGHSVARALASAPGAQLHFSGTITTLLFRGGSDLPTDNSAPNGTRPGDPEGFCTPRIIVDGIVVFAKTFNYPGALLEDVVNLEEMVGVEVHTGPATLPPQWSGTGTSCTTVIIWTNRSRPRGG